ncbi:hypothetical protein ES705_28939 [subsurface metagenome]
MKVLNYLSWAAAVIAAALIVLGTIAYISGFHAFGVVKAINFFHTANSFLLVVICCMLYRRAMQSEGK